MSEYMYGTCTFSYFDFVTLYIPVLAMCEPNLIPNGSHGATDLFHIVQENGQQWLTKQGQYYKLITAHQHAVVPSTEISLFIRKSHTCNCTLTATSN